MSPIIIILAGAKLTLALVGAVAELMTARRALATAEISSLEQSPRRVSR